MIQESAFHGISAPCSGMIAMRALARHLLSMQVVRIFEPIVDAGGQDLGARAGAEEGAVDNLRVLHARHFCGAAVVCRCRYQCFDMKCLYCSDAQMVDHVLQVATDHPQHDAATICAERARQREWAT